MKSVELQKTFEENEQSLESNPLNNSKSPTEAFNETNEDGMHEKRERIKILEMQINMYKNRIEEMVSEEKELRSKIIATMCNIEYLKSEIKGISKRLWRLVDNMYQRRRASQRSLGKEDDPIETESGWVRMGDIMYKPNDTIYFPKVSMAEPKNTLEKSNHVINAPTNMAGTQNNLSNIPNSKLDMQKDSPKISNNIQNMPNDTTTILKDAPIISNDIKDIPIISNDIKVIPNATVNISNYVINMAYLKYLKRWFLLASGFICYMICYVLKKIVQFLIFCAYIFIAFILPFVLYKVPEALFDIAIWFIKKAIIFLQNEHLHRVIISAFYFLPNTIERAAIWYVKKDRKKEMKVVRDYLIVFAMCFIFVVCSSSKDAYGDRRSKVYWTPFKK